MGFGQVATTLLMFTASVALAAVVVGFVSTMVQDMIRSGQLRGREVAAQLRTDVQIINDPAAMPTAPTRVYIKNTGSESLAANVTTLVVDGLVRSNATATVLNGTSGDMWRPGEVLEIRDTTLTLAAGDHTLLVTTQRGVQDSLRVRV